MPFASAASGVHVAVSVDALYVIEVDTDPDPPDKVKLIVPDCTDSLKTALTAVVVATPVAPAAGVLLVIVGAGCATVVNDQVTGPLMGSPTGSVAALIVAVYVVE